MKNSHSIPGFSIPPFAQLAWILALILGFAAQFFLEFMRSSPIIQIFANNSTHISDLNAELDFYIPPSHSLSQISLSLQSICFLLVPIYLVVILGFTDIGIFDFNENSDSSFEILNQTVYLDSDPIEEEKENENSTNQQISEIKPNITNRKNSNVCPFKKKSRKFSQVSTKGGRKDSKEAIENLQTSNSDESFYADFSHQNSREIVIEKSAENSQNVNSEKFKVSVSLT